LGFDFFPNFMMYIFDIQSAAIPADGPSCGFRILGHLLGVTLSTFSLPLELVTSLESR
jgi:hypothetical protein